MYLKDKTRVIHVRITENTHKKLYKGFTEINKVLPFKISYSEYLRIVLEDKVKDLKL